MCTVNGRQELLHDLIRRAAVRLAEHSQQLPTTLMLQDVRVQDKETVDRGGYANIYKGMWSEHKVALKILRLKIGEEGKNHKVTTPHASLLTKLTST